MLIREIQKLLSTDLLFGEELLDREIKTACGSDLMSDVLVYVKNDTVLLTGLTNSHVVRTAEMLDVSLIVFVRGKIPSEEILSMAVDRKIVIMSSAHTLFDACGILYSSGLRGVCRLDER